MRRAWLAIVAMCLASASHAVAPTVPVQVTPDLEILPLAEILERLAAVQPGRVIEVELEVEDGVLIYEIELIEIVPPGHA